ncbi:MAG TPA: hypothetical protein VHT02_06115 [Methylocella sp.]|jgi:hypothetical protein|nr:hypothetical protein [Methylocella sp.]
MTHGTDYFQEAADQIGGIEGLHLRCSKGRWTADDIPMDGAKIVVIVPTLATGIIKWLDGKPAERRVGRVADGCISKPVPPDDTWNPYAECSVVFIDDEHRGAPGTYTTSAWGGYFSITKLLRPYSRTRTYPVCTLATKPRGDTNGNIDPVFVITGWANPADFPGYGPAPQLAPANPAPKLTYENRRDPPAVETAELISDEIPF